MRGDDNDGDIDSLAQYERQCALRCVLCEFFQCSPSREKKRRGGREKERESGIEIRGNRDRYRRKGGPLKTMYP